MGKDATDAFRDGIDALIRRMRAEWHLTYAECVGVLELVKMDVWSEAAEDLDEDSGDDDGRVSL